MNLQPTTLIISAELAGLPFSQNMNRTITLKGMLEDLGLGFKEVDGYYKGDSETSLVVPLHDISLKDTLVQIMLDKFNQESILELTPNRHAILVSKKEEISLGKFKAVSELEAKSNYRYTYDSSTGQYWIAS